MTQTRFYHEHVYRLVFMGKTRKLHPRPRHPGVNCLHTWQQSQFCTLTSLGTCSWKATWLSGLLQYKNLSDCLYQETLQVSTEENYISQDQSLNKSNVQLYFSPGTDCTSAQLIILYRGTDQRPYHTHQNHSQSQLSYTDILQEKTAGSIIANHYKYYKKVHSWRESLHVKNMYLKQNPPSQPASLLAVNFQYVSRHTSQALPVTWLLQSHWPVLMSHSELSAELFTPVTLHAHSEMNKTIYKYYLHVSEKWARKTIIKW